MHKELAEKIEEIEEIFNISSIRLSNAGFRQRLDYYLGSCESQNGYIDANKEILDLKKELKQMAEINQQYQIFFSSSSWKRMSKTFSFLPKVRRFTRQIKKTQDQS